LKGLLKGFWWPFRLLKLVKYSWSYGPNEVCNRLEVRTMQIMEVVIEGVDLLEKIRKSDAKDDKVIKLVEKMKQARVKILREKE